MWPNTKLAKLRWVDVNSPSLSIGSVSSYTQLQYSINDAFDPNPAVATAGMPGFSQYASMYHNYRVMGTRIDVEAMPAYSTVPVVIGIHMDAGTVTVTNWLGAMQLINSNTDSVSKGATAQQKARLSIYRSLGKLSGNAVNYASETGFNPQTNASPTSLMSGYIYACNAGGGATGSTEVIYVKITLTMWVRFSDRKQIFGV